MIIWEGPEEKEFSKGRTLSTNQAWNEMTNSKIDRFITWIKYTPFVEVGGNDKELN